MAHNKTLKQLDNQEAFMPTPVHHGKSWRQMLESMGNKNQQKAILKKKRKK